MLQKQLKLLNLITKSPLPSPVLSNWEIKNTALLWLLFFKVNLMMLPDGQPELEILNTLQRKPWCRHKSKQITILAGLGSFPMLIEMLFLKNIQLWQNKSK